MLGHGEEHGGIFERFEGVPGGRDDEQIPRGTFPADVPGTEADPPVQHMNGGLARVVMLIQPVASGERDHGLTQHVLVASVHGVRAAPAGGVPRDLQLFPGQRSKRRLLHELIFHGR